MPNLPSHTCLALILTAGSASAYSISTALTTACHEPLSMEALRQARLDNPAIRPLEAATRDDRALIDDLPFRVDADMRDLGAVALLIGVRDNDLKGRDPNELDAIALVHGEPDTQREHCLRGPDDDEPKGSAAALLACRSFIREMFVDALEGLDAEGLPTLDSRVSVGVSLSLRGKTHVQLPRFYVRIGQGIHALQDSFSHTYRTGDGSKITVALNYIDVVDNKYSAPRDGPPHSLELDNCWGQDPLQIRNHTLAVQASTALFDLASDPARTYDEKIAALEPLLDQWLVLEPGCTDANGWCDAREEIVQANKGCGCGVGGGLGGLLAIGLGLFATRRRATRGIWVALAVMVPLAAQAQTQPTEEPTKEPIVAVVPITASEARAVEKEAGHRSLFSIYVAGSGSFYNVAASAALGVRLHLGNHWQLGLDGELNGWYGIHARRLRTGATNVYLSVIYRYPLKFEPINLRSNLQLGVAIQMLDLVGVPAGSVGIFAGLNPIGLEIKLTRHLYLIFYPLGVALPATQLKGVPFAFTQFRTTLGLEVTF